MRDDTKSKRDRKASGGFETKSPVLKRQHLSVVDISVVVVIAQANAHHSLPPPQVKNCCFLSLKTFMQSGQNQSLFSKISPENFREIGFILTNFFQQNLSWIFLQNSCKIGRFFHEFVSGNPTEFDFFSATYQRPCVMNGLCYKSSCLPFSLSPATFLHQCQ